MRAKVIDRVGPIDGNLSVLAQSVQMRAPESALVMVIIPVKASYMRKDDKS